MVLTTGARRPSDGRPSPAFEEGTPQINVCCDDFGREGANRGILVELGWPGATDVGDIESAQYLGAIVPLWVRVGAVMDTLEHAFKAGR